MSYVPRRLLRVPLVALVIGVVFTALTPLAMNAYTAFPIGRSTPCVVQLGGPFRVQTVVTCERALSAKYERPFLDLMLDAAARSAILLVGAAILALVIGSMLGLVIALLRRRALASGGIVGVLTLLAAIPSFFLAYFLQIVVIVLGAREGGNILPVFGFGYDTHVVLPLVALALPAVAYTAQLTATRLQEVLDAEFITAARAKGLLESRIVRVHALPHVRPVMLEALGSALRVSVASLPIVEVLFGWRGIGALSLEAIGAKDAQAFVFCAVALVLVFAVLSAIADLSRPRALYRA